MTENYEHYISRNIQAFYRRRLFSPTVYLILLFILWLAFPLKNALFATELTKDTDLAQVYNAGNSYAVANFTNLNFTGYISKSFGKTTGYYYYAKWNNQYTIVLLSPSTCQEGLPVIDQINVRGKIMKSNNSYQALLTALSDDLKWTTEGISKKLSTYYFSEPDYHIGAIIFMFIVYFGTGIYALISLIVYSLYARFPVLSPPVQNLIVFGHPKKQLEEAEDELATLPQLATEDMFITEHYFIMTSPYGNAIVPIDQILWIYKHSTLHKFLWYHFSISYTMHIIANKHLYIHCPKNIKSDIDGIMDYLAEANHNVCVGFSEENRLRTEAVLGKPFHIEKLYAFLRRKV